MKLLEKMFGIKKTEEIPVPIVEEGSMYPLIDLELFKQPGVLFIVGDSGTGLTSTARLISHWLIDKDYYKVLSVFAGVSTSFEYILGSYMRYFHRSVDIDYPEVISGEKGVKYIYGDIANKLQGYIPPNIYLFDVRFFLDDVVYVGLIKSFFEYFTEVKGQILVVDNIGSNFTKIPGNLIEEASKENLIIMNVQVIEPVEDFIRENENSVSLLFLRKGLSGKKFLTQTTQLIPEDLKDKFFDLEFVANKYQEVLVRTPKGDSFYKLPFVCCYKDYIEFIK